MKIKLPRIVFLILFVCIEHMVLFAQQGDWRLEAGKIKDPYNRFIWLTDCVKENKRFVKDQAEMLDAAFSIAEQLKRDSVFGRAHLAIGKYYESNGEIHGAWDEYLLAKKYGLRSRKFDDASRAVMNQCYLLLQQGLPDSALAFLLHNETLFRLASGRIKLHVKVLHASFLAEAGNRDEALKVYDEIIPVIENGKDTAMLIPVFLNRSQLAIQYDSAVYWLKRCIPMSVGNNRYRYPEVMFKIGLSFLGRDDAHGDSALNYFLLAEKEIDQFTNVVTKAQLKNCIGSYFINKNEYEIGLPYLREAYMYGHLIEGSETNLIAHNLAICFLNLNQYDSASFYLNVFRKKIAHAGTDYEFELYHHALARQLSAKGDSCSVNVIANLNKALVYAERIEDTRLATPIITDGIHCLLEHKATQEVRALATEMLAHCSFFHALIKADSNLFFYSEFLSSYAKLEGAYGSEQKALKLYDELTGVFKELDQERYMQGREESLIKYKSDIKDNEIAYARKKNTLLTIGAILLALIVIIIFAGLWKTSRLNKQITKQSEKIGRQKDELEKLNSVKDRLFSVISHDLRTPVSSLISFSRLLENGNITGEKLNAYMTEMKRTLGYTSTLMSNLLNWARTQMSGYKPVMETLSLADVAIETMELLQPEAARKEITFINTIDHHLKVYADQHMTSLVLRNLMMNAIKYSHKGGTVEVDAKVEKEDIRVTITDHGTGMDTAMVNEFNSASKNPLQSTPGTLNESGTGLGLMLSKSFVELMDGKMVLKSEAGKGCAFAVYLRKN